MWHYIPDYNGRSESVKHAGATNKLWRQRTCTYLYKTGVWRSEVDVDVIGVADEPDIANGPSSLVPECTTDPPPPPPPGDDCD